MLTHTHIYIHIQILYVFFHMYHLRKSLKLKPLELGGQRYTAWKNELITMERYLLKELGFSFYQNIEHPHKYLLYYIKVGRFSSHCSCRVYLCSFKMMYVTVDNTRQRLTQTC
jgi:hypothetical protein